MLQSRIDDYTAVAAKEPKQVLRELPTSTLSPEYREIKGYKPAEDELLTLPTSRRVQEPIFQPEAMAYETKMQSNPLPENWNGGPWSSKDVMSRGSAPNARFQKQIGEEVIHNPIDDILGLPQGAKYEQKFVGAKDTALRQNPAEVIYGREVPASYKPGSTTVIDETERIAGPTPIQTSAWKTTSANKVGDAAWQQIAMSQEGKAFDKSLSGGLRQSTEDAVGRASGKETQELLKQHNSELGQILTTEERALMDAEAEARRNSFTSIDGLAGAADPTLLAAKKAADFSKTTRFRTSGGKAVHDASERVAQMFRKTPRLAQLEQSNPKAFAAMVSGVAGRVGKGSEYGGMSKAAGFNPQKPQDDQEARDAFLDQ
jgi:hypothetical protein